jgi:rhomboid protease GluP
MFSRTENIKQYIKLYPITTLLICLNIALWALMEGYGSSQDSSTLIRFGAIFDLPNMKAEAWRYVTAIFLHNGLAHLFFNSFAMYVFAPPLERMLGKGRYLFCYLVSGVAGNMSSAWLHPDYFVSVGASGAIFGIYAAYLFLAMFRKDMIDRQMKQTVVTIIVVGFLNTFMVPNVDIYAHLGGFIGGMIAMVLITLSIRRNYRKTSEKG